MLKCNNVCFALKTTAKVIRKFYDVIKVGFNVALCNLETWICVVYS